MSDLNWFRLLFCVIFCSIKLVVLLQSVDEYSSFALKYLEQLTNCKVKLRTKTQEVVTSKKKKNRLRFPTHC